MFSMNFGKFSRNTKLKFEQHFWEIQWKIISVKCETWINFQCYFNKLHVFTVFVVAKTNLHQYSLPKSIKKGNFPDLLETQKVKTTVNTFRKIQNLQWSAVFSTTFFCTLHYFSLASALLLQPSSSLIPHPSSLIPCSPSLTHISYLYSLIRSYSSSFVPHPLPFIPPH